jgi:hypothetical protein
MTGTRGVLGDGADQALAAAGDDEVDAAVDLHQFAHGFAVGGGDELDGVAGRPFGLAALLEGLGDGEVGVQGLFAAA